MVAPPSLEDVQRAVQEASEQAEGHGAEEVLKELLERVVEAALGQAEGEEIAESDKKSPEEEVIDERRDAIVDKEKEKVIKSVNEGKVDEDGNDVTSPVNAALARLKTRGTEEEVDYIAEFPVTKVIQEVVCERIVASRKTKQGRELQEACEEEVETLGTKVTVKENRQESEIMTANPKLDSKIELEFNSSHLMSEDERETDNYETEVTHAAEGGLWDEENIVKDAGEQELENNQGHLATQGWLAEVVNAENIAIKETEGEERHGPSGTKEESVSAVHEEAAKQLIGEQTLLESLHENKEDKGEECLHFL